MSRKNIKKISFDELYECNPINDITMHNLSSDHPILSPSSLTNSLIKTPPYQKALSE